MELNIVDKYEKLEKVGEATYGKVYKAQDKATGQLVAAPAGRERAPRPVVGAQGKRSVESSRRARATPADRFPSDLLDEAVRSPRSRG